MRKKNYKGRCEKRAVKKCGTICKTFDPIQSAFVTILDNRNDIVEIKCNVELEGDASDFTTDIVAVMTNGELMVRECVSRKILSRPLTLKWLEISQTYWYRRGVKDERPELFFCTDAGLAVAVVDEQASKRRR